MTSTLNTCPTKRAELMYPDEYRVMFELEDHYWWYRGVRTLLRALLERYAPPNARLLDGGCGTGANLRWLEEFGSAIGVDISLQAIRFCRARGLPAARAFVASLDELPFPNDGFDVVISTEVICNIADDAATFVELARVLKPGGVLIVQVPAYQWLWSIHDVAVGHRRRYAGRDLRAKIERAGFRIERLTHANAFFLPAIAAERLAFRSVRTGRVVRSDLQPLPALVNAMLSALFVAEMRLVSRVDLPYGLSLIAVARKSVGSGAWAV